MVPPTWSADTRLPYGRIAMGNLPISAISFSPRHTAYHGLRYLLCDGPGRDEDCSPPPAQKSSMSQLPRCTLHFRDGSKRESGLFRAYVGFARVRTSLSHSNHSASYLLGHHL